MSKVAAIAFACAGVGFADLICIDAWLLPALVATQPYASASAGMAAAGLVTSPVHAESAATAPAVAPAVDTGRIAALAGQPVRADATAAVHEAAATPSPAVAVTPTIASVAAASS